MSKALNIKNKTYHYNKNDFYNSAQKMRELDRIINLEEGNRYIFTNNNYHHVVYVYSDNTIEIELIAINPEKELSSKRSRNTIFYKNHSRLDLILEIAREWSILEYHAFQNSI